MSLRAPSIHAAIVVTVTCIYLLAGSRERPWGDAQVMYEVADGLGTRGAIDIQFHWPPMSHAGPDGKIYSIYGLAASVVSLPGVWLRHGIDAVWPAGKPLTWVITSHLASALLGALTCLIFFRACRRAGAGARAASLATLALAFATAIFVYARYPFSEMLQVLAFTGFVDELWRTSDDPRRGRALRLGAWAGLLLNTKAVLAVSVAGGAVFLILALRKDRRAIARVAGWGAAAFAPGLAAFLIYNQLRWGGPLVTGYEEVFVQFQQRIWEGLWGLLLSPGKSLLLYSPPLVAAAVVWPRFARTHKRLALAFAAAAVPTLVFYARYTSWSGDWCWGPRYIAFVIPFAMVPLALALDALHRTRRWIASAAISLSLVAGLGVQLVGNAFYWDHFIRISMDARDQWLGRPDRSGSLVRVGKDGRCGSCVEDMYPLQWLPPFNHIEGNWWLLRHVAAGDTAKEAERDAPWHRYTQKPLAIEGSYHRARIDWWGLVWIRDHKGQTAVGLALLLAFLAGAVAGAIGWIRAVRRDGRPE